MCTHEKRISTRLPAWLGQRPSAQALLRSRLKLEVEHGRKGRGNSGLPSPLALTPLCRPPCLEPTLREHPCWHQAKPQA